MFDHGIMQPLADEIAQRSNVPITERGMVEGGRGLFAAWFNTVSDETARSVSPERRDARWAKVD